tara:strand:+ start:28 stop:576 length:549 start_codon:yes stop_codon:yes gene_type:complete
MSCDISSGRIVDCKDSVGGIKTLYIGNYADMVDNSSFTEANDIISAIGAQTFYTFELRPELSSLSVNYMADAAAGTTYFQQALSVTFQKLDSTDIIDIRTLCQGRPNIWVLDNNDNAYLLGAVHGCNVTGGAITSGAGFGDLNGFTIEFEGKEKNPLFKATPSAGAGTSMYPLDNVTGATIA